ncbi:MAG: hypothetical protein LQ352_003988 [Teloschistes flavicans]|nr:MAG: hypothetical protein LQ352_003988 [Teloschistes flavicans]
MYAHVTHILKVGRNNFKPPPQVDSAVVRLVPKWPRPGVAFEEWDAMLRVCFGRKHRMLRAGWMGRKVLEWVEGCWRETCAFNGVAVDEGSGSVERMDVEPAANGGDHSHRGTGNAGEEEWDGIMDVDDETNNPQADPEEEEEEDDDDLPDFLKQEAKTANVSSSSSKRKKRSKVAELVREKVRKVLEDDTGFADRRAVTLDQNNFLRLLLAFNKEGIRFS